MRVWLRSAAAATAAPVERRPRGGCSRAPHAARAGWPACGDAPTPTGLRTSIVCVGVFGHRRGAHPIRRLGPVAGRPWDRAAYTPDGNVSLAAPQVCNKLVTIGMGIIPLMQGIRAILSP